MTQTPPQRFMVIALLTLLLAAAAWVVGQAFNEPVAPPHAPTKAVATSDPVRALYQEAGVFQGRDQRSRFVDLSQSGTRSLDSYYQRRAYPGAPPFIPHPVDQDMKTAFNACNGCHEKGGFVARFQAFAPQTPHANYSNCRQCHVPQADETLFQATTWQTMTPPALGRAALPGSPPPIPHALHMRENCSACHAGPAAPMEIRTTHPERLSCRQCHMKTTTDAPFTRSLSARQPGGTP